MVDECTFNFYKDFNELMKGFLPKEWKAFVYFISDGTYVKIGRTSNIVKRFSQIKVGNANKLELLGIIPFETIEESVDKESMLHQEYKECRVSGEWYYVSDFDIVCDIDEYDGNCKQELWDLWYEEAKKLRELEIKHENTT